MTLQSFPLRMLPALFVTTLIAVLMATSAAAAPSAQESPSVTAQIDIPETLVMSDQGTGQDAHFVWVTSTGGPIQLTTVGEPVVLPIPVHRGVELETYTDTVTGITVAEVEGGYRLRIPIRDANGSDTIRIIATVPVFMGTGATVEGVAQSIEIDLPTASVDLSSVDPTVGTASVKVVGTLKSAPGLSGMTMTLQKEPGASQADAIVDAAAQSGLAVEKVGFAVQFDKQNLDEAIDTITLRLDIGNAWVQSAGAENVRVFRVADDGSTGFVDAEIVDANADPVRINVTSPEGLSTFAIAAVGDLPPTPTPTAAPEPTPTATTVPTATPAATAPIPTPTATAAETKDGGGGCNRSAAASHERGLGDLTLVAVVGALIGVSRRRRG